ncbi:MAG: IclR family transcriptional regulator [Microbacterium sp.]|nr:IclR family transcriptional regulator [Microbacterium sp.]
MAGSGQLPGVRNAVALLHRLAASPRPLTAGALSRALSIPRSSTYLLLQVLEDEGLVRRMPEEHAYTLGLGAFEIGSAYLRHASLEHLARPLLARLARRVGETAQLGVLHGNETIYLLKETPPHPTALITEVGIRLPAHLTASGRSMLSVLPFKQVLAYFAAPGSFPRLTGSGPSTARELHQLLREDAARGWAIERGAVTDGISCIAAAVRDGAGYPVASVVVSFPSGRHESHLDTIASDVVAAAAELAHRLGAP